MYALCRLFEIVIVNIVLCDWKERHFVIIVMIFDIFKTTIFSHLIVLNHR